MVELKGPLPKHAVGAGMQQAPDYAELLDVPFAYRSNGRPHPTLAEQHHIIAYVAHRMFVVDASEQSLAAVRATTAIFLSALPTTNKTRALHSSSSSPA